MRESWCGGEWVKRGVCWRPTGCYCAEIKELRAKLDDWQETAARAETEAATLRAENERLRGALTRIDQWADAYPLEVFPEPDFAKAEEVLKATGLSLSAVSASNMRHVIEGVKAITRAALEGKHE